jgi:diguanylate cyclase (GGDEF)-like protein
MTERLPARVFAHFIPGGLILIALSWTVGHMHVIPPSTIDFMRWAPYGVFAVGLLLSTLFQRSRIFHALLVLLACDAALALTSGRVSEISANLLVVLLALLLPLNLVLISCLPETGLYSRAGIVRLAVFAAQGIAIAIAMRYYAAPALRYLGRPFIRILPFDNFRGLPHSVLVAVTLGFLIMLLQLIRRRFRPTEIGLYWALLSSLVAVCVASTIKLSSIAFTAGALVLLIALLEAFYAMAYFDELTDLPSRRSFNDAKLRLGSTYTVAMVDVDHFKQFNDTFGHDAGDQVLRMVASRIREVTGGGKGYRFGGEEFAVLFSGKYVDETFPHLERLRRSIEDLPFKLRSGDRRAGKKRRLSIRRRPAKQQTNITVSIGVAGVDGDRRKPDDMVKAADTALYRAKSCGRNCTIISDAEVHA